MAHIDLKKDAHIFTQAGVTIQNLLNVVQSFEANELEDLRDLINVIKDIDTNDDNADFKQQLINAINNAVMESEVVDTLDKDSTYPPQATTVRKALNNLLDNINQIKSNLDDETKNRQDEDAKTVNLIKEESSSRETGDNSIKQELYGTGTESFTLTSNITPTQVTVSMQNGSGIVEVNISDLKNAFTLNGAQIVSSGKTIATYQITYGENISRLFAVVDYNVQLKTFDFNLVKSDDMTSSVEGNIATLVLGLIEFDYGFNTGQGYFLKNVSNSFPYTYQNVSQNTVIKINGLADLQTIDKSSFMSAINELARTDIKVNESLNSIREQLDIMPKGGVWHYGTSLTHTTNIVDTPITNNDIIANVGDFYLNSNTFSVYFCVGDNKGNHNWLYIGNLAGSFDYSNYASINSPNFTGTPTAPTPSVSNNSRQVATTEYVRSAIDKYASGDGLEMIDLVEGLRDDVYGKQIVWTAGGNIMNLTLPVPKIVDVNSEKVSITFDKGIIPFSNNDMELWNLPLSATTVEFIPVSRNKTYINCEFNIDTQAFTLTTSDSAILDNVFENRIWKFTICYYTISVVYNDSSEEPPSQFVISNYDCDWMGNKFSITLPYQTLRNLSTDDKTSLICATNEIKKQAVETENNVGEIIYALHPNITTYDTNSSEDIFYGKLIKTNLNELFVLINNCVPDESELSDIGALGIDAFGTKTPIYITASSGYNLTKPIYSKEKAFCKITKTSPSNGFGEIEVLLTF